MNVHIIKKKNNMLNLRIHKDNINIKKKSSRKHYKCIFHFLCSEKKIDELPLDELPLAAECKNYRENCNELIKLHRFCIHFYECPCPGLVNNARNANGCKYY